MTKTNTSQFKAKLGYYMREVREGREVIVTDRDKPVARLVPYTSRDTSPNTLDIFRDPSAPALADVKIEAVNYRGPSTLELLAEERNS
ncbi:MAG: type II toxin-antitoxin system Phd/YefM family antitoxin [Myxococcota bacterium]